MKAIVVLKDEKSLNEDIAPAHCKAKLGSMKSPKSVEFWRDLLEDSSREAGPQGNAQALLGFGRSRRALIEVD